MLMAAGLGTRLRPFTDLAPKPLLPVLGVPMAQFGIDLLVRAGVRTVVANIHHQPEKARAGLEGLDLGGARLEISDETELLLGSAGGIRKALAKLGGEPFFLLNADVLCDVDLGALASWHGRLRERHGVALTLAVFPAGPAGGKYREIKLDYAKSLIRGLGEPAERRPFFVGAAVIEPEALEHVPPEGASEFVPTLLQPAIQAGKAGAFLASGHWHDIGSAPLWLQAHLSLMESLETGRIPECWKNRIEARSTRLKPGVWVEKGNSTQMNPDSFTGPCFWSDPGSVEAGSRPKGPRAVVYGKIADGERLSGGIGLGGVWVKESG